MPGISSILRDIVNDSREIRLLSDSHGYAPTGLDSSQIQIHLPEVCAPARYLIDVGLRPALARRLSSIYMDIVDRCRKACQSHFHRVTHREGHFNEYYREVFTVLFERTVQAWDSRFVSIIRVRLSQAGSPQASIRPERVEIRVDDATKAEIIARLGLKATHLTCDKMVTSPGDNVTLRLEEVSEQIHALSTDSADSHSMLPSSPPISSTSIRYDLFSRVTSQTCFPAPYPPAPSTSCLPQNALPTSFIPPAPPRDVRSLASRSPDMSTLIDLFGKMTFTTTATDSRTPRSHGVSYVPDSNRVKPLSPIPSPNVADISTRPQLASVESIPSPTKSTNPPRRRKIASLPTRRGKTSASSSPPVFDSAGAASHPITPSLTEQVVEGTRLDYVFASPQNTRLVSTLPSLYPAEASYVAMSKLSAPRQRKGQALRKMLPPSQTIPQNRASTPLASDWGTFSYTVSGSPPFVSDATSYFDSPPTSSDELDTPPSSPPPSHVLLARTSTESLDISSEPDGIISYKEPLRDAKLPNPRQRHRRLDFTKGGLSRDDQPLTFTFSV